MASNTSLPQGSVARELATSVVVGVGGLLACFGLIIGCGLSALALREVWVRLTNAPVTFHRCDAQDPLCCKTGPHGLGYASLHLAF